MNKVKEHWDTYAWIYLSLFIAMGLLVYFNPIKIEVSHNLTYADAEEEPTINGTINTSNMSEESLDLLFGNASIFDYNSPELSLRIANLSEIKYQIQIDCGWVSEHINDTIVSFSFKVVELCQEAFPKLNYSFHGGNE